jgi:O-antigen/teichoic acid export membrane protein
VLVGKVVGVESAGLYGLALAVITNLQPLIHALATPMTTLASEWEASRARSTLHQTLQSVTTVTSGLGGVVMLGTFAFAAPVVRLFLGSDGWTASSVQTAAHALAIMGIGVWCGAITLPLRSVMQGTGRHWLVMRVQTGASLAGLALGAGLLASGAGVPGAAAAWTCVWAVQWFATAAATRLDPALGGLFGWAVLASTVRSGLATLIAAVTLQRLLGAPGSIAGTLAAIGLSAGAGGLATFWPWLEQLARQRRRRAADGR